MYPPHAWVGKNWYANFLSVPTVLMLSSRLWWFGRTCIRRIKIHCLSYLNTVRKNTLRVRELIVTLKNSYIIFHLIFLLISNFKTSYNMFNNKCDYSKFEYWIFFFYFYFALARFIVLSQLKFFNFRSFWYFDI